MKRILLLILAPIASLIGQNLQISGGNNYSAAVCDNQIVQVWGANTSGQLATDNTGAAIGAAYRATAGNVTKGNISTTLTPSIGDLPTIKQVDAGSGAHLLGLSCAKQVWSWGENLQGQLGRNAIGTGSTPANYVPSRVLAGAQDAARNNAAMDPSNIYLDNISYISGGNNSSFAVEEGTGYVLAWGDNSFGQLGDGTTVDKSTPVYVQKEGGGRLANIVSLEGGDICTYALDANGNVWSWGVTNDGVNAASNLGRTPAATIPGATAGTCAPRAGLVTVGDDPLNPGYSNCTTTPLSNIVQISGGDTHCLALDGNGNVWSFGGDWAEGQLGRGNQAVYHLCANRVVAPGVVKTAGWVATDFLGSGVDGKAVYIAAGQASSAVVMSNGKVVAFGSRGMFNSGATPTGSGATITCPSGGDVIGGGTLGDNNATCNLTTCANKATATTQSRTPVYVTGIPNGVKITQVSDGDAWYFAISSTGTVYTWGWNRRGELGSGDYVDRCQATALTLSSCTLGAPCPDKPLLGADITECPALVNEVLNANIQNYSSYVYNWYYSLTLGSALTSWTPVGTNSSTYTATQIGYYILEVSDNRALVGSECGPCKKQYDTLRIIARTNPYVATACTDNVNGLVSFTVTTPLNTNVKWYTTLTGLGVGPNGTGTGPLNPSDSKNTIIVKKSILGTNPACGSGKAIYAEDEDSDIGTLLPATSIATAQTVTGCNSTGGQSNGGTGNVLTMQITVTSPITIKEVSAIIPSGKSANYYVAIYNDNGSNQVGTSRTSSTPTPVTTGGSQQVISLNTNIALPVGKYWIGIGGGDVSMFDCTRPTTGTQWTTPYNDVPGKTGKSYVKGTYGNVNNTYGKIGSAFNIKFDVGTGYTCGRLLVCEDASNTCTLPVTYIYFNAIKLGKNVNLTWSTADEDNTKAFAIYRSFDNVNFVKVGEKSAKFNGHSYNDYDYTDHLEVNAGNAYYRIVEIDISGANSSGSNTVSVNLGGYNSSISIAPNPSAGSFRVSLDRESDLIDIKVVDLAGKQIHSQVGAGNSVNVNLGGAHKGVYLIYVFDGTDKWVEKIVVE